jgi:hypothetical protein
MTSVLSELELSGNNESHFVPSLYLDRLPTAPGSVSTKSITWIDREVGDHDDDVVCLTLTGYCPLS